MRVAVPDDCWDRALEEVREWLLYRIREKGNGSFVSFNELWGIVDVEHYELKDALHRRHSMDIYNELKDLAVACLFGIASMMAITKEGSV